MLLVRFISFTAMVRMYVNLRKTPAEFDVAAALGLDPAYKLAPRNAKPEYLTPWRPTDLEPPSVHHDKRQACTYPLNDCRFFPGGAALQGYSRCTFNCQAVIVFQSLDKKFFVPDADFFPFINRFA